MTSKERIAEIQELNDLYRADQNAAHVIIDALGVGAVGMNLRTRLPLAIRAVEEAERKRIVKLIITYAIDRPEYALACDDLIAVIREV